MKKLFFLKKINRYFVEKRHPEGFPPGPRAPLPYLGDYAVLGPR